MSDEYTCDDCLHAREATDNEIEFGTHFCKIDKKFVERVINCSVWEEKKVETYKNNIRIQYKIYPNKENAYLYNKGYIMGLNDGKSVKDEDAFKLIELNYHLRKKEV